MNTSMAWAIESSLLDIYFLLVHRIEGLGLSLNDFWAMDTWTTSKLLRMEEAIIEEEQKEYNKQNNVYEERPDGNSEEMNDLVDEYTIE